MVTINCFDLVVFAVGYVISRNVSQIWGMVTFFVCLFVLFYKYIVPLEFLPWKIQVALPKGKPTATELGYPIYGACWMFQFCKIHRTLTWTTGSSTFIQVLIHAIAHGGVRTP